MTLISSVFSQSPIEHLEKDDSIQHYDNIIAKNPSLKDAYYNRSRLKYLQSDYSGALEDISKVIALDSVDYEALFYRGFIKAELKYYKNPSSVIDPYEDYNKALMINPDYGLAYSYRGLQKMRDGNLSDALKDCDLGVVKMPDNKFCFFNRAQVREELKDYQDAIKDYDKVIEIDPTYFLALSRSARLKEIIKDYAGAVNDYTLFLKLTPNSPLLYLDRGKAKLAMKDKVGACEDFEQARQLGCNDRQLERLIKKNCKN